MTKKKPKKTEKELEKERKRLLVLIVLLFVACYFSFVYEAPKKENPDKFTPLQNALVKRTAESGEGISYYGLFIDVVPGGHLDHSLLLKFDSHGDMFRTGVATTVTKFRTLADGSKRQHKIKIKKSFLNSKRYPLKQEKLDETLVIMSGKKEQQLLEGENVYEVDYRLSGATDFSKNGESFTINAIALNWYVPIEQAVITLRFPPSVDLSTVDITGHIANVGGKLEAGTVKKEQESGRVTLWPGRNLKPFEGFEVTAKWSSN